MNEQIASEKAKEEELRQKINEVESRENSGDNKVKHRVFENAAENRTPAYLIFGVTPEVKGINIKTKEVV